MKENWINVTDHPENVWDEEKGLFRQVWKAPVADMEPFTKWIVKENKGKQQQVSRVEMIGQSIEHKAVNHNVLYVVYFQGA